MFWKLDVGLTDLRGSFDIFGVSTDERLLLLVVVVSVLVVVVRARAHTLVSIKKHQSTIQCRLSLHLLYWLVPKESLGKDLGIRVHHLQC